ncbi:hypothetical protein OIU77_025828 [Salix suchowensis]|uniref:Uncharacterized protein n=1 Tax=Salix suchowensis TaxID=1278906 RepID=A0ABQ9BXK7_9ROSI|nr:hypothetical protein OIU77_025828 [Salix suchowensis]
MNSFMHLWMSTRIVSIRLSRRCLECRRLLLRGILMLRKSRVLFLSEPQWQSRMSSPVL